MRMALTVLAGIFIAGCGVPSNMQPKEDSGTPVGMELLGGFGDHETVVMLDGKEIYRGKVHSNPVLGKGTRCGALAGNDTFKLEVRVKAMNISCERTFNLKAGPFLDIKVINGEVQVNQLANGNKIYE